MTTTNNLLVGKPPEDILIFGADKMFIDEYLWFEEEIGIAAVYTVKSKDTEGHFDILRGVDMIEILGQACTSVCTVLECKKTNKTRNELKAYLRFVFLGLDECRFDDYAKTGDLLICLAHISFYRFRQMTLNGSLFKVEKGFDYHTFFENYSASDFQKEALPTAFQRIANIKNITGRGIKLSKLITN